MTFKELKLLDKKYTGWVIFSVVKHQPLGTDIQNKAYVIYLNYLFWKYTVTNASKWLFYPTPLPIYTIFMKLNTKSH